MSSLPLSDAPIIAATDEPVSESPVRSASAVGDPLTPVEVAVLEFERQWWRVAGAKEQAIRTEFDLSPARYYQVLNGLLDRPAALAHDPMLIKRLRRLRLSRLRSAAVGSSAGGH